MRADLLHIGEAEDVTVTLPAASGWEDALNDSGADSVVPYWETTWRGVITAWTGGVEYGDGYDEDLSALREEALAMLAAVAAAERYLARRETS